MYSSISPKRVILISSLKRPNVSFITKKSAIKYTSIKSNKPLSKGFIALSSLRSFMRVKRNYLSFRSSLYTANAIREASVRLRALIVAPEILGMSFFSLSIFSVDIL